MASIIRTTWNDFLIGLFPAIFFLFKITDPQQFDEQFFVFLVTVFCNAMSNCMISITLPLLALHLPCVSNREYSHGSHLETNYSLQYTTPLENVKIVFF